MPNALASFARGLAALVRKGDGFPAGTPLRSSFWGPMREPYSGAWQDGVTPDPIGSLTSFGAVFACISHIANDIAKLEPELKVDSDDGICIDAPATSPFWRCLQRPNTYQNRIQFLCYWLTTKLLYGNAYQFKIRESVRGMVQALYPLDPRRVTPFVTPDGDVYYSLGGDNLSRIPLGGMIPASEIIHDRAVTLWHPLVGVSPLYACALSATLGHKIQKNSATFFQNMSRPSGMLTAPGTIDDITAKRIKSEWEQNYSAHNLGRLAIMGDGLTYAPMTIPAETSQLIQQLDWTVADVARTMGVPLYKINSGPIPTNNNVEALELQYYTGCLQILIESVELCLTEGLEMPAGYGAEFSLDGLLRMDTVSQIESLSKGILGGLMKPNEGRQKLNLGPVTGGDTVYLQQQNYSLEALAKRDAGTDPFASAKTPAASPAPQPTPAPAPSNLAIEAQVQRMLETAERGAVAADEQRKAINDFGAAAVEREAAQRERMDAAFAEADRAAEERRTAAEAKHAEAILAREQAAEAARATDMEKMRLMVEHLSAAIPSAAAEAVAKAMPAPVDQPPADIEKFADALLAGLAELEIG